MKTLLRTARESKGLKTREVARLLNIDAALISKFESGQRNPTREQLVKLSALLEIDFDTILVLWLKEKILREIANEELGLLALKAAEAELSPISEPQKPNAIDQLFEEMEALKNKLEGLRNTQ